MKTIFMVGALIVGGLAIWSFGVMAGRHNWVPVPQMFALKDRIVRTLKPQGWWQRAIHDDVSGLEPAPCPENAIVLLFGGQSNVANSLSTPLDANKDVPAFMFWDGACYPIADPIPGTSGQGGNVATAIGQALAGETERPVLVMNMAVAATSYAGWLDRRTGLLPRFEGGLASLSAAGFKPDLVLWHQGETDAHKRTREQSSFEAELTRLIDTLSEIDELADAKIVLSRTTRCSGDRTAGLPALHAAQTAVGRAHPNAILGPDTDRIGPRGRQDGCHFNARGRDEFVSLTLPILRDALGLGERP